MKKWLCAVCLPVFLSAALAFSASAEAGNPETVRIDLVREATDEELSEALRTVESEMRARLKAHLELDRTELKLVRGTGETLSAEIRDLEEGLSAGGFSWTSSDESVATVSDRGAVRGVSAGSAVITCSTTLSNGFEICAECPVEVRVPVSSIGTDPWELTMVPGTEAGIEVIITPKDATNRTVEFSSSDEEIATVSGDGVITARAMGKCDITVAATDGSEQRAKIRVTVRQEVQDITIEAPADRIGVEETLQLKGTVLPGDAYNKRIDWSSSDGSVAEVDDTGKVTGIAAGTAVITAKAADGAGAEASFPVEVIRQVKTISVEDNPVILAEFTYWKQQISVEPENANDRGILWTSSDESVATVDEEGTITGHKTGTCKVTGTAADGYGAAVEVDVEVRAFHYVLRTPDEMEVGFATESSSASSSGMGLTILQPNGTTGTMTLNMPGGSIGTLTPGTAGGSTETQTPSGTLTPNFPGADAEIQTPTVPSPSSDGAGTLTPSMPSPSSESTGTLTPSMPSPSSGSGGTLTPSMPSPSSGSGGTLTPSMPSPSSGGGGTLTPSMMPSPSSGSTGTLTPSMMPSPSNSGSGMRMPSMGGMMMNVKSNVEVDYGNGCVTSENPGKIKPVKPGCDKVTVRYVNSRNGRVNNKIVYDIYVAQSACEEPEADEETEQLIREYLEQKNRDADSGS